MLFLSHQFSTQSGTRTDSGQGDAAGVELHGKKTRFDFERFSALPREMFAFFSKPTD